MATNFWNNAAVEPKRNFRFELSIGGSNLNQDAVSEFTWLVKTVERPKANISSVPHKYLNHTFNYPGRLVWNPIAITLVDPVSPIDASDEVYKFLQLAGYKVPGGTAEDSHYAAQSALLKDKATAGSVGTVHIRMLGDNAGTPIIGKYSDQWTLHNTFVQGDVNWGSLDYGNEELLTLSLTLQYDWATFKGSGGKDSGPGGGITGS